MNKIIDLIISSDIPLVLLELRNNVTNKIRDEIKKYYENRLKQNR